MTKIRILRIIEYVYDSVEVAQEDMLRWTNTFRTPNNSINFTSVTLPFSTISEDELPLPPGIAAEIERLRTLIAHSRRDRLTPWEVVEFAADQLESPTSTA